MNELYKVWKLQDMHAEIYIVDFKSYMHRQSRWVLYLQFYIDTGHFDLSFPEKINKRQLCCTSQMGYFFFSKKLRKQTISMDNPSYLDISNIKPFEGPKHYFLSIRLPLEDAIGAMEK